MILRLAHLSILILFLFTSLHAQLGLSIEAYRRDFNAKAIEDIQGLYFAKTERYVVEPGSFLRVEVSLDKSGIRTLEGLDIRSTGKATCVFQVRNLLTEESACYRLQVPITGHAENASIESRVVQHLSTSQHWCDSLSEILDLVSPGKEQDCTELVLLLDQDHQEDWHTSLLRVIRFKRTFRNCLEISTSILEKKLEEIDQIQCESALYDATLLFNTGTNQSINRAVRILLQIPPQSPCREKALALSESNAKNYRLSRKSKDQLARYRDALLVNNTDDWLDMQIND